jgi:adenosylhomocysteine nucleosidase
MAGRRLIAVAFALDAEFAPWRARRAFAPADAAGGSGFEATIGALTIRAGIVGIGARRLARITPWLLDSGAEAAIVAGLAGGLSARHRTADVLVAGRVCHDTEQCAVDARLLALAKASGATPVDRFVTVGRLASTRAAKQTLAAAGDSVDIESFHVLEAAARRGIPVVAVRAIGDAVSDNFPIDFEPAITADGSLSLAAVAAQAALRPWAWPRLIRFVRDQRRALDALSVVLDSLAVSLAGV